MSQTLRFVSTTQALTKMKFLALAREGRYSPYAVDSAPRSRIIQEDEREQETLVSRMMRKIDNTFSGRIVSPLL